MKKETKLRKCVEERKVITKSYKLTPTQLTYVNRKERSELNMAVPKRAQKLPDYLTASEIFILLQKNQDEPFTVLLLEFLIKTGLRISETRNLTVQDIDFSHLQLKVVSGKGNKDRQVPLTQSLAHKIKLHLQGRQRGYVFARSDEKPYTVRAFQYRVKKALNLCGFTKDLHTHSLRHTYACLLLSKGMQLERIKLLMGHEDLKTTQIYAKLELGDVKEQYLQLMGD